MVLLSASICTKAGKPLVARQFMEISRSRVEGLLAAFPKLRGTDEQHTFVETDTVRYVYRPVEQLYIVLITTKNSNILQDLETMRLFSRVVPEICRNVTESEVVKHAFDLIAAFDEIIALGYPENVNLSQIRTYTEMNSHEEAIYKMVKENKEREAREIMKRKAKELQLQKRQMERSGGSRGGGTTYGEREYAWGKETPAPQPAPAAAAASSTSTTDAAKKPGKGMKLGGKAKASDFVEQLIAEGEQVLPEPTPASLAATSSAAASAPVVAPSESIHVKVDEKITLRANRDGGLEEMEVKGTMFVSVFDAEKAKMQLRIRKDPSKNVPYQTHPNIDKKAFASEDTIRLKSADKPFPTNTEVGVVKWRILSTDEEQIPLSINCWPNPNPDGTCDVNIEFELKVKEMELHNVSITIPLPSGGGAPKVANADGDYKYNPTSSVLIWSLPLVDADNATGAMEFSVNSNDANDFFPVLVDFSADKTYAGLSVEEIELLEGGALKFSSDIRFSAEAYEIV